MSQALYGIMIAYPTMSEDEQIEKALRISLKMMKRNERTHSTTKRTKLRRQIGLENLADGFPHSRE